MKRLPNTDSASLIGLALAELKIGPHSIVLNFDSAEGSASATIMVPVLQTIPGEEQALFDPSDPRSPYKFGYFITKKIISFDAAHRSTIHFRFEDGLILTVSNTSVSAHEALLLVFDDRFVVY